MCYRYSGLPVWINFRSQINILQQRKFNLPSKLIQNGNPTLRAGPVDFLFFFRYDDKNIPLIRAMYAAELYPNVSSTDSLSVQEYFTKLANDRVTGIQRKIG